MSEPAVSIKVLTYNIHKGVCYYTRKVVLEELRLGIRAVNPDIVFLQEVCGDSPRRAMGKQLEFLADAIWPHVAYGKNAIYSKGHHGNAILSKFPIEVHSNLDISTSRFERRGLLHAVVQIPKLGEVHLFCLHLDLLERGRQVQIDRIVQKISGTVDSQPMILAGDFNDWRMRLSDRLGKELTVREAGLTHLGRHAKTFPSLRPVWALDRIYFRGMALRGYEVLEGGSWQNLSDHLAVTAEFLER